MKRLNLNGTDEHLHLKLLFLGDEALTWKEFPLMNLPCMYSIIRLYAAFETTLII